MCKVFPSSLGPVAMRWFNGLRTNSIDSYRQLTQAFGSRFVTNRRAPRPLSALLSLSMHDGETLKAYSDRYWETYNEMEDNFDDVAIIIFKNSLPADHGLQKSLTGKPTTSMRQLMIGSTSTSEWRKTSYREEEKRRLSLRREGISGRTGMATTARRGTL